MESVFDILHLRTTRTQRFIREVIFHIEIIEFYFEISKRLDIKLLNFIINITCAKIGLDPLIQIVQDYTKSHSH